MQHERVDQRIDGEVILTVRLAHECAAVIQVDRYSLVIVGVIRMILPADLVDDRVDLNRVDMFGPMRQRTLDVIARAGPDDQHILERPSPGVAIEQMRQDIRRPRLVDLVHRLMADVVRADTPLLLGVLDLIIRRP